MPMPKGTPVQQVIHPITGVTSGTRFNEDTNQFEYLVDYSDADGNAVQRWFTETEIQEAA